MGMNINYDQDTGGAAGFVERTGVTPSTVGSYVGMEGDNFATDAARQKIDDAVAGGASTASISIPASGTISDAQAQGIAEAVEYGKSQGVNVDIRLGYEMNFAGSSSFNGGDTQLFKDNWAKVADAVHGAGGNMVWSPNIAEAGESEYRNWLPDDPSTIDKVGIDIYHWPQDSDTSINGNALHQGLAGINPIAEELGKPLIIAETGVNATNGISAEAGTAMKKQWLEMLSDPTLKAEFPNYAGFNWFDIQKPEEGEQRNFALSQGDAEIAMFQDFAAANLD
jgi:hypothetical protein